MMIAIAAGAISAAEAPCTIRARISTTPVQASPHNRDATANSATPAMNTRRRPKRSAALPPSSSSPPKVSA